MTQLSLVVMTRNRSQLLKRCLASLSVQNYPLDQCEVLIIDDGSTDDTEAVVASFTAQHTTARYVKQAHGGVSSARNAGIKHAKGTIISFLADDYELPVDYAKTVIAFFEKNPRAQALCCRIIGQEEATAFSRAVYHYFNVSFLNLLSLVQGRKIKNAGEMIVYRFSRIRCNETAGLYFGLCASRAAAFRKELFERIGFFDETLKSSEDTDLGMRMTQAGMGMYYYPQLAIRHSADVGLAGIIRKQFFYGFNLYDFKKKHPRHPIVSANNFKGALYFLVNIIVGPVWRSIQAKTVRDVFLFFPVMFLMNASYTAGVFFRQFQEGLFCANKK